MTALATPRSIALSYRHLNPGNFLHLAFILLMVMSCQIALAQMGWAQEAAREATKEQRLDRSRQPQADEEAKRRLDLMKKSVATVDIAIDKETPIELKLQAEPLLRWDNPVCSVKDGTVFIWTSGGRPEVAAQVFVVPNDVWLQEFQSLSAERLTGKNAGKLFWNPTAPGVEMKPLTDVREPAKTTTARLIQMRSIARSYSVTDIFEESEPNELRLLSKPLYRYKDPDNGILDGALFAFVLGTDPEVLLQVEAHSTALKTEWRVGFAPMTSYECRVKHEGNLVWSCPRRPPPNRATETFFFLIYDAPKEE